MSTPDERVVLDPGDVRAMALMQAVSLVSAYTIDGSPTQAVFNAATKFEAYLTDGTLPSAEDFDRDG